MADQHGNRRGRLPDFLIIGAAKCGTSTLHGYLCRHPEIHMSPIKEPCFFDQDVSWNKGLDWYRDLFAGARSGQICGEASTNYTRWPQVPQVPARIYENLPGVRLIYMMRHPVDRAYSHYLHRHTKEVYPGESFIKTFEEFVADDPMCLDSSDYMLQIKQYLEFFEPESFLFLFTEELRTEPASVLGRVCRFLGVEDQANLLAEGPLFTNVSDSFRYHTTRRRTVAPLRSVTLIDRLGSLAPRRVRDLAYNLLTLTPHGRRVAKAHTPVPMQPQTRRRLLDRYREGNRALATFLGVELPNWDQ